MMPCKVIAQGLLCGTIVNDQVSFVKRQAERIEITSDPLPWPMIVHQRQLLLLRSGRRRYS